MEFKEGDKVKLSKDSCFYCNNPSQLGDNVGVVILVYPDYLTVDWIDKNTGIEKRNTYFKEDLVPYKSFKGN